MSLKCDLQPAGCGQCRRAQAVCSGYRGTEALRIKDQTQDVQSKALTRNSAPLKLQAMTLAVDVKARDAFFNIYIDRATESWQFLISACQLARLAGSSDGDYRCREPGVLWNASLVSGRARRSQGAIQLSPAQDSRGGSKPRDCLAEHDHTAGAPARPLGEVHQRPAQ